MLSCYSRVQPFVILWTVAHQAPLSVRFSKQEYWGGLPFPSPGDLPPRDLAGISCISCTAGGFFTSEPQASLIFYAIHGVAKSQTRLSNWTELNYITFLVTVHHIDFSAHYLWTTVWKTLLKSKVIRIFTSRFLEVKFTITHSSFDNISNKVIKSVKLSDIAS